MKKTKGTSKKIMWAGNLTKQTALRDLQGTRVSLEEAQLAAGGCKQAAAAVVEGLLCVCYYGAVQAALMRHHLALLLLNFSLAPQGGEQVVMVCISKDANQENGYAKLKDEPAGRLARGDIPMVMSSIQGSGRLALAMLS